jgi:hypothetical protein
MEDRRTQQVLSQASDQRASEVLIQNCKNTILNYFLNMLNLLHTFNQTNFNPEQFETQLLAYTRNELNQMPQFMQDEEFITYNYYQHLTDLHFAVYCAFFCLNKHPGIISKIKPAYLKRFQIYVYEFASVYYQCLFDTRYPVVQITLIRNYFIKDLYQTENFELKPMIEGLRKTPPLKLLAEYLRHSLSADTISHGVVITVYPCKKIKNNLLYLQKATSL